MVKNDNPIKTMHVKRANRERDEIIPNQYGGKAATQSKYYWFTNQQLTCLDLASCDSTFIKSSYILEVQVEASNFVGSTLESVSFPINIYKKLNTKSKQKRIYPMESDFPKAFEPLLMAGSHFFIASSYN